MSLAGAETDHALRDGFARILLSVSWHYARLGLGAEDARGKARPSPWLLEASVVANCHPDFWHRLPQARALLRTASR